MHEPPEVHGSHRATRSMRRGDHGMKLRFALDERITTPSACLGVANSDGPLAVSNTSTPQVVSWVDEAGSWYVAVERALTIPTQLEARSMR